MQNIFYHFALLNAALVSFHHVTGTVFPSRTMMTEKVATAMASINRRSVVFRVRYGFLVSFQHITGIAFPSRSDVAEQRKCQCDAFNESAARWFSMYAFLTSFYHVNITVFPSRSVMNKENGYCEDLKESPVQHSFVVGGL